LGQELLRGPADPGDRDVRTAEVAGVLRSFDYLSRGAVGSAAKSRRLSSKRGPRTCRPMFHREVSKPPIGGSACSLDPRPGC